MKAIDSRMEKRLRSESNIWVATVRPDGRPHLTPVWFAWHDAKLYICIDPNSVKAHNLASNPHVALALEDGSQPIIIEGDSRQVAESELPSGAIDEFKRKYAWDISTDAQYRCVIEATPTKVLNWSAGG